MKKASTYQYTLLEMVLAVTIFSMIMLTVVSGLFAVHKNWEKISKHQKDLSEKVMLDTLADAVIRNAVPFTWPDDISKTEKPLFRGNGEDIYIVSRRWIGDVSTGGLRFVNLFVANGKLMAKHAAVPIEENFLNNESSAGYVKCEVISENVRNIRFLYAERENKKLVWVNDWNEENDENLPLAVQFTVEWNDGRTESWLRRTAGSGIKENLGLRKDYGLEVKTKN